MIPGSGARQKIFCEINQKAQPRLGGLASIFGKYHGKFWRDTLPEASAVNCAVLSCKRRAMPPTLGRQKAYLILYHALSDFGQEIPLFWRIKSIHAAQKQPNHSGLRPLYHAAGSLHKLLQNFLKKSNLRK